MVINMDNQKFITEVKFEFTPIELEKEILEKF